MKHTLHSYTGMCLDCQPREKCFRSLFEAKIWQLAHIARYPTHWDATSIGEQWVEQEEIPERFEL